MDQLFALLSDASFWQAVAAVALPLLAMRGGIGQQIVTALGNVIGGWLKGRVPANQYSLIQQYAGDAVTYAFQRAEASWGNQDKQDAALAYLQNVLSAHGLKWDEATLRMIIDLVWSQQKQQVVNTALQAQASKAALDAYTAALAAGTSNPGEVGGHGEVDQIGPLPAGMFAPGSQASAVTLNGTYSTAPFDPSAAARATVGGMIAGS